MIKPLSFNDWLEEYQDELPETGDLYDYYNQYVASVEEANLTAQLNIL